MSYDPGSVHTLDNMPLAYLLTFTCYGTHLHGSAKGSVDRFNNTFGEPYLPIDWSREEAIRSRLSWPGYTLDSFNQRFTLIAIREVCSEKDWDLLAAHVRSTHVHSVITAPIHPRYIRAALKRRASTIICQGRRERRGTRRWTAGGSSRYLWTLDQVKAAVDYVVRGQGDPMEVYEKPGWYWQLM
jgi:REP element-mobilizing transposase RayT